MRLLGRIDARKNPVLSLRRSRPQRSIGALGAKWVQNAGSQQAQCVAQAQIVQQTQIVPQAQIAPVGRAVPGVASIGNGHELTREWLTAAFRYRGYLGPHGEVTSVVLRPPTEGLGALGDVLKVEVTLAGAAPSAPTRFVAKFAPQGRTPIPRFLVKHTFLSETHFYTDFDMEEGGLPRPECYFALADLSRRKLTFVLLIEDMVPAHCFSRTAGCRDVEPLMSVMASLARLHARWWGHPRGDPLEWAPHPNDYAGAGGHVWRYLERAGLKALPACFGDDYAQVLEWAPLVLRRQRSIFRRLFAKPLTLCHGDAHLDNIFFNERFADGCALVDFGNMMFGQVWPRGRAGCGLWQPVVAVKGRELTCQNLPHNALPSQPSRSVDKIPPRTTPPPHPVRRALLSGPLGRRLLSGDQCPNRDEEAARGALPAFLPHAAD